MRNTRSVSAAIELFTIASLSIVLGACTQRSTILTSETASSVLSCQVTVNPNPVAVSVNSSGAIQGTAPTVTFAVVPNQSAQITSIVVTRPAGLQMQAFGTPSPYQSTFLLTATPLDATSNSVQFFVNNGAGESASCSAPVSYSTTTSGSSGPTTTNFRFQFVGDVNADTISDRIAWDYTTGYWYVSLGMGTPNYVYWGIWGASQNWQNVTAIDINNDARIDIIGRDATSGNWWAAVSTGSSFINQYLGAWPANVSWTNVRFAPNAQGILCIYGTDLNGVEWQLTINAYGSPSQIQPVASTLTLGVASSSSVPSSPLAVVNYGGTAYVTWRALSASSCVVSTTDGISIGSGNQGTSVPLSGITSAKTVQLVCQGANGAPLSPVTALIQVGQGSAPVLSLSASSMVARGSTVAVTWAASNVVANTCTLTANGAPITLPANSSGSTVISPPVYASMTFILACQSPPPYEPAMKSLVVSTQSVVAATPTSMQFGSVEEDKDSYPQTLVLRSDTNDTTVNYITMPPGFSIKSSNCGSAPFVI